MLRPKDEYAIVTDRPITIQGSEPHRVVLPAIAIPVDNKSEFLCPSEHVQTMQHCLAEVSKVLIVGWRATENHFLELLRTKLTKKPKLMVVAKDEPEGRALGQQLNGAGIGESFEAAPNGFSSEIRQDHRIESFLWREVADAATT